MRSLTTASLLTISLTGPYALTAACPADVAGEIRLAVLYHQELGGFIRGFWDAVDEWPSVRDRLSICEQAYSGDQDGIGSLVRIVLEDQADLVLGPTFSGVFIGAHKELEGIAESRQVPVVSPIVQADEIPNDARGWFFRTNVSIPSRVEKVLNFVTNQGVTSIAVLHADTGFGRRAEEEFQRRLRRKGDVFYTSAEYKRSGFGNLHDVVGRLLKERPEALGIFGSPEEIIKILDTIRDQAVYPYEPIVFTIVDPSLLVPLGKLSGLHFVSVSKEVDDVARKRTSQAEDTQLRFADEFEALAYDTTDIVLSVLDDLDATDRFHKEDFRDRFVGVLRNRRESGAKSGMSFYNLQNMSSPGIYHTEGKRIIEAAAPIHQNLWSLASLKWELLGRRFGNWPQINLGILLVITLVLTGLDLNRTFEGKFRKIFQFGYFYLLCGFNALVVVLFYFYLGENRYIRYDDWQMAIIVAMSPSVLLRTTLFETPTGKAIGLAHLYDRFLFWINEQMMVRSYVTFGSYVNVIAFYNRTKRLEEKLRAINRNARTRELQDRLDSELSEELARIEDFLEQRRICARKLLKRFDWQELKQEFAPRAREFQRDPPSDPELLVNDCASFCQVEPARQQLLDKAVEERLDKTEDPTARREGLAREIAADPEGEVYLKVRLLVTRYEHTPADLKRQKLLPDDYKLPSVDTRSAVRKWWDKLFRGRVSHQQQSNPEESKAEAT